jgi:hypothetical protein
MVATANLVPSISGLLMSIDMYSSLFLFVF